PRFQRTRRPPPHWTGGLARPSPPPGSPDGLERTRAALRVPPGWHVPAAGGRRSTTPPRHRPPPRRPTPAGRTRAHRRTAPTGRPATPAAPSTRSARTPAAATTTPQHAALLKHPCGATPPRR